MNEQHYDSQTRVVRELIDETISQSVNQEWNDKVLSIPGILLIRRLEACPPETDCQEFLFGHETIDLGKLSKITSPMKGAIVIYCDSNGNVKHVGISTSRGTIISKWGTGGHVYEHKPDCVPSDYGKPKYYANFKKLSYYSVANLL
jgi:hypothetical protein